MKKIFSWLIILLLSGSICVSVAAEGHEEQTIYEEQTETSGAQKFFESLPDDIKNKLEDAGVSDLNAETFQRLDFGSILLSFLPSIQRQVGEPLKALMIIFALLIFAAILQSIRGPSIEGTLSTAFDVMIMVSISAAVLLPLVQFILRTGDVLLALSRLMLGFIPVYAGLLIANGLPTSAGIYNTVVFSLCHIISQITTVFLIPFLNIFLSLNIFSGLAPKLRLSEFASFIGNLVKWALGFMMCIFIGFMALQNSISAVSDSVVTRSAKFVVTSFVPVVGGALSEAFNTIAGCAGLIKTGVGVVGILAICFMVIPFLVEVLIWLFSVKLSICAADILQNDSVKSILKGVGTVIEVLLAILLTVSALLIISIGVTLAARGGS